jgi:rubrerythrin
MSLEETYRKRKEAYTSARRVYKEVIDTFAKEKQKILDEALRKAKLDAEAEYNSRYGQDEFEAKKLLEEADNELALLRCPKENYHDRPTDRYFRCDLCGFVWDDTSPAHP